MGWFKKRLRHYGPAMILDALEERIVLDASIAAAVDNHATSTAAQTTGTDVHTADASAGTNNTAATTATTDSTHEASVVVPQQKLNVVLVASDVTASEAAQVKVVEGAIVIVYDSSQNGLSSIAATLDNLVNMTGEKIGTLAIVDHGTDAHIKIGTDLIMPANMVKFASVFEHLGQDLAPDAQIEFYGCSIAQSVDGQALINQVASYTHSVVFASTDPTGGTSDWTLEYSSDPNATIVPLLTMGTGTGSELIFSGWPTLDNLDTCYQYFSALDSEDLNAAYSGTNLTTQYAEIWTFHLDVDTDVMVGMQTCHPDLTHSHSGNNSNNLFIDCWLDLFSGTTPSSSTRIAYIDDWVGPGTNQVPDWSGNDSLLAGGTTLHLAAGDYCIQATSWNDGSYNYMNGGYYLLSNVPLNTPTTGHYVAPPTSQDIPDQEKPVNFGTFNYDVHSYFSDTPGEGLTYELAANPTYINGLTLSGLTINATTGVITFTSSTGSYGAVEVRVRAHDGELYTSYETFTLTVQPAYALPSADAANITMAYGTTSITFDVYGHDPNPTPHPVNQVSFDVVYNYSTTHGTLTKVGTAVYDGLDADGHGLYHQTYTYTPAGGYWGPDGFQFTFSTQGGTWSGMTNMTGITIGVVNDTANTYGVALADIDGDGHLDLLTAKSNGTTSPDIKTNYYLNDGYGAFQGGVNLQYLTGTAASDAIEIAYGDFNGDGFMDAVVRNGVSGGTSTQADVIYFWDNTAHGFSPVFELTKSTAQSTGAIAVADINGDGRPDIIRVHDLTGEIYLNDGQGNFSVTPSYTLPTVPGTYGTTGTYSCIATGDLNNDGSVDIFVGKTGGTTTYYNDVIFYNDRFADLSYGNFTSAHTRTLPNTGRGAANDCEVADLDGDGDLDIVVARGNATNYYYRNEGITAGIVTWGAHQITTDNNDSRGIRVADMDRDGDLDVVVANYGGRLRLYTYDDGTGFTGTSVSSGNLNALSLDVGDVDGNGTVDIVVGMSGSRDQLFYNRGFGTGTTLHHADPAKVSIQVETITNWSFENASPYLNWNMTESYETPGPPAYILPEFGTFGIVSGAQAGHKIDFGDVIHDYYDNNDQYQFSLQLLDPTVFSPMPGITVHGSQTDHTAVILSGGLRDAVLTHDPVTIARDTNIAFLALDWDMSYWNSNPEKASGQKFDADQFISVTIYDYDNPSTSTTWTTTNANSSASGVQGSMRHYSIVVPSTNALVQKIASSGIRLGVKVEVDGMEWYLDAAIDDFKLVPYRHGSFGTASLGVPALMDASLLDTQFAADSLAVTNTSTNVSAVSSLGTDPSLASINLTSGATSTSLLGTLEGASTSLASLSFADPSATTITLPPSSSLSPVPETPTAPQTDTVPEKTTVTTTTADPLSETEVVQQTATLMTTPDTLYADLYDGPIQDMYVADASHHYSDQGHVTDAQNDVIKDLLAKDFDSRSALVFDTSQVNALHILEANTSVIGFQQPLDSRGMDERLRGGEALVFDMDAIRVTAI